MTRLLFWLGLALLVVFAVRSKLRGLQQRPPEAPPAPRPDPQAGYRARAASAAVAEAETMLCCAHCGIYYPSSETVQAGGHDYCSTAHAGLAAARQ